MAVLRYGKIGFAFQQFHLLPRLRAPGPGECVQHTPAQLSGGQRQRVALALLIALPNL